MSSNDEERTAVEQATIHPRGRFTATTVSVEPKTKISNGVPYLLIGLRTEHGELFTCITESRQAIKEMGTRSEIVVNHVRWRGAVRADVMVLSTAPPTT